MRFVALGAGAIGGALAARLAHAGHEVIAIARGAHLAAIRAHGLRLEAPDGELVQPLTTVERAAEIVWRADDVVLLSIKTQGIAAALGELAAVAPVTTPIACLTNGVEAERLAQRWFRDVHAVCVMSSGSFLTPGVVQQFGAPVRGVFDLGRYPQGRDALDDALASAFRSAGYTSDPLADVMRWKRGKLLVNLANALEALCGPTARTTALATMARLEGVACFEAAGLARISDAEEAARRVGLTYAKIGESDRAGGSTWQSLARGAGEPDAERGGERRRVEVECDYLNGEIARLGRAHGVPTPINELLQRLVAEAARAGRAPGTMTVEAILARLA